MRKFSTIINEANDLEKYKTLKSEVKSLIDSTIDNSGGEFESFVDKYNKSPDDVKIEGLINSSDIYEFYLKHRNDIDELLVDIKFFDEIPTELNVYGLYDYIIRGTERCIREIVKSL